MYRLIAIALICAGASGAAFAQLCPVRRPPKPIDSGFDYGLEPSAQRSISGVIVYHDDLRKWFGLRTNTAICGESELQLWVADVPKRGSDLRKRIETARGCSATITGRLSFADPVDREAVIQVRVSEVLPDPTCTTKSDLPDTNKLRPNPTVQKYVVTMTASLAGQGSMRVVTQAKSRTLYPWQAYAAYSLDEGHIIAATCGYGFAVSNVSGSPVRAFKNIYDAVMDIESVSHDRASALSMTYTCTRVAAP